MNVPTVLAPVAVACAARGVPRTVGGRCHPAQGKPIRSHHSEKTFDVDLAYAEWSLKSSPPLHIDRDVGVVSPCCGWRACCQM
jgi:hypothetical protein